MTGKKLLLFVLAISLIFASCSDSKDIKDVIPADANYVVCMDTKSLVAKSEYDIFSNPTIQPYLGMYKGTLKDEATVKMFDAFLKDVNSMGLDLKGDVYFYTNYKVYGVVLGVNNADKVKEALIKFSMGKEEDIKKQDDIYLFAPEKQACVAWNGSKMLLLVDIASAYDYSGEAKDTLKLPELAAAQLKQGSDKSINSNSQFKDFLKEKKDISIFFTAKGLDKSFSDLAKLTAATEATIPFKKLLEDMEGVSTGAYTSFEKGEVKFESKYFFESSEAEKKYKDLVAQLTGTIKGDQLKYITGEPLFLVSANIKGEGAYAYLEKLGIMKMMTGELPENIDATKVQNILKDLNGDITFAVTPKSNAKQESDTLDEYQRPEAPDFVLFADVAKPAEVVDFIKQQLAGSEVPLTELSSTNFKMTEGGMDIYWGTNDNTFFLTNNKAAYDNLKATGLTNNYAATVKDKSVVIFGNLQVLQTYMKDNMQFQALAPFVNEFGKYEFVTGKDLAGTGKLELATKDKNSLSVICKKVDELIANFAGMFR